MSTQSLGLHNLSKVTVRAPKRRGQGIGSGKGGHTSGRGTKGQKGREHVAALFSGTKMKKSLLKRLPLMRGKGKFKSRTVKPLVVNLKYLNLLPKNTEVTPETLMKAGIIRDGPVKILGEGDLQVALIVKVPTSRGAARKIAKAGGKVILE
jgi:large subunit ribosomal protein L15